MAPKYHCVFVTDSYVVHDAAKGYTLIHDIAFKQYIHSSLSDVRTELFIIRFAINFIPTESIVLPIIVSNKFI